MRRKNTSAESAVKKLRKKRDQSRSTNEIFRVSISEKEHCVRDTLSIKTRGETKITKSNKTGKNLENNKEQNVALKRKTRHGESRMPKTH